jgi:hypothetical protein
MGGPSIRCRSWLISLLTPALHDQLRSCKPARPYAQTGLLGQARLCLGEIRAPLPKGVISCELPLMRYVPLFALTSPFLPSSEGRVFRGSIAPGRLG